AHDLTRIQGEADIVHSDQTTELLADLVRFQNQRTRLGTLTLRQGLGLWRRRLFALLCTENLFPGLVQARPQTVASVLQIQHHQDTENDQLQVDVGIEQLEQPVLQLLFQAQYHGRAQNRAPNTACTTQYSY